MTARSKSKRQANRKLKSEKNKVKQKELKRLHKIVSGGKELMEVCSEVIDEKKVQEIKEKQLEATLKKEFIEEVKEKIEASTSKKATKKKRKGKVMKIKNENTGKLHEFDTKTLKDQYGSYPPWLNVGNHKRKIKRRKTAIQKGQFNIGSVL
ncbi:gelsolin-related protein of 125 kDa [Chironomus tepperi]|uniref:gelsolin-related protein of 125 kDa n=1 Tax=Chironomus tepperi TaxID=113505 RepID=UPI00391F1D17